MSLETPERPLRPEPLVEQVGDLGCAHAPLLDQVQHDARVELARPRAHRQAVERGEAHRALDAAPLAQRAHRGAAAEMGDDHPAAGDVGRDRAQPLGDVFVGEAVEAVAAHALVVERARQRVAVGVRRMAAVEGGVEAGDLRHVRVDLLREPDRREVVRLVQRRQRRERGRAGRARPHRPAPAGRSPGRRARRGGRSRAARSRRGSRSQRRSSAVAAGRSGRSAGAIAPGRPAPPRPRPLALRRGCTPMPSICPLTRRSSRSPSIAKIWNFRLDEPALTTRIACIRPPAPRPSPGARRRRAQRRRRRRAGCAPSRRAR